MLIVTAVVTSLGEVHIIPMVFGSLFIFDRTRLLRETAGAFSLSNANVVLIWDLLWSEISISFQPSFIDTQYSILFAVVLGEGR